MLDLCLESTSFLEKVKEKSIISSVDKDNNNLGDKKEAVVKAAVAEKKVLTTEKVKTSEEVYKRTKKIG